ncbi:MAG: hypothetical protein IJ298_06345 [Ruminococcus sp.]|nr:hypothetical protein [Ruminococcus sp.]
MAYIPDSHRKYNLLPYCSEHGGEVFSYPSQLLDIVNKYTSDNECLIPYGYDSYEEYYRKVREIADRFITQPYIYDLFTEYLNQVMAMNIKEDWSVLRYIGPDTNQTEGLTNGKNYYWPASKAAPHYEGVIDDEEFTSYIYPTNEEYWEILEDPTGMAHNTIFGKDRYISPDVHAYIIEQLQNATIV